MVAKNWKLRRCPIIGEWLNKLWYMNVMEYYCFIRNDEQAGFRKILKDLHELIMSGVSRIKRTLYKITATLYSFDRLSSSQQSKDLRKVQKTHNGKCYPHPEKELWSLNAEGSMLFALLFFCCFVSSFSWFFPLVLILLYIMTNVKICLI